MDIVCFWGWKWGIIAEFVWDLDGKRKGEMGEVGGSLFKKVYLCTQNNFEMETLEKTYKIDRETENKVAFMVFIITEFAHAYKMNRPEAFRYLKKYGGLEFIDECWDGLHTESSFWAVRDIYEVCYSNGGLK